MTNRELITPDTIPPHDTTTPHPGVVSVDTKQMTRLTGSLAPTSSRLTGDLADKGEAERRAYMDGNTHALGAVGTNLEVNVAFVDEDKISDSSDEESTSRAEVLFAPFEDVTSEEQEADYYDKLFSGELEAKAPADMTEEHRKKVAAKERFNVTEESLQEAEGSFRQARVDEEISAAIDEYKSRNGVYLERDIMKGLREDKTLRVSVGTRLLDMVNTYPYGTGIKEDRKTPNHPGYESLRDLKPEEYVSLLMLAMIDGTFKPNDSASKPIEFARDKQNLTNGRSRSAAVRILNSIRY